jgi:hypothetical protein
MGDFTVLLYDIVCKHACSIIYYFKKFLLKTLTITKIINQMFYSILTLKIDFSTKRLISKLFYCI